MRRAAPAVLSIAGSDSGGGAGIQADLKAFAACGVHGMTAITALTAQNTVGRHRVHPVPGDFIVEQVRAVAQDIGVDAVKIGMLGTAETVEAVARRSTCWTPGTPIVIDPVMVAESGAVLLDDAARAALVERLLPRATVITPNLPEARVLRGPGGGESPRTRRRSRARCTRSDPANVVVTGGHREEATDVLFDGDGSIASRARGTRTAPRMARAARTRRRWPRTSRSATTRSSAARAAKAIAGDAVRDGLREHRPRAGSGRRPRARAQNRAPGWAAGRRRLGYDRAR